jgi:O-antigen/teichoic acid export membrane protein
LIAWAIAFVFAALYTAAKLRALAPLRPRWRRSQLREMFRFGLQSYLSEASLQLNMRFDFLLVSFYTGSVGLGLYSISALVSQFPWIFPHGLSYALYPRVTASSPAEAARLTEKGMRHGFLLSLLTGAAIALTARFLVPVVFGREFAESVRPLLVLLPGAVFFGLTWLQSMYLIGQAGKPLKVGYAYLVIFVLNIVLNVLLTPRHGIVGAAAASSLARLVGCAILFQMVSAESKSAWRSFILPRREDLGELRQEISSMLRLVMRRG